MNVPFRRVSIPVSQYRLVAAGITAFFFGVLLYLASTRLNWLTLTNVFILLIGIAGGWLLGWFDSRTVIRGLTKNTETIVWQTLPVSILMFGLPLLLGKLVLADSEFLPFAGYLTLPAIPVLSAVSGWRFHQFEKKNEVQVFVLFTGYSYYRAPMIVDSNRFYHFIRQVASKDSDALWMQTGYSGRLMAALEERQDVDSVTRKELLDVLKVMNKFRWTAVTVLALFIVSACGIVAPIFTDMVGLTNVLNADTINIIGPASGGIFLVFGITVFLLLRTFKKKISNIIAQIDSEKLAPL
jgi:hypothetical protein